MKVEAGKCYHYRAGGISGPLELVDDYESGTYLCDPKSGYWYDPKDKKYGHCVFSFRDDAADLVAEAVTPD